MASPLPRPPARFKEIRTKPVAHYRKPVYTQATNKRQGCSGMKLVEILARELKAWPQGISAITQDISTSVWGFSSDKALPICNERGLWYSPEGINLVMREIGIDDVALSSDHVTAIVTRSDWEAERANINAASVIIAKPANNPNKDGWIRHRGGKCPVEAGALVDVRYRSGVICEGVTALIYHGDDGFESSRSDYLDLAVDWSHTKSDGDIMRYKLHKPAEQSAPASEPESELLYDPVAQGPLQWRDRIRELDTQRAEVESDYQRQISEITQERESLVQRLAGEGFSLIGDKPGALLTWQRYAKDGMKINAIKEYRELTGAGLRKAKETVEAYQDSLD